MKKGFAYRQILFLSLSVFIFTSFVSFTSKSATLQNNNPFAYLPTSTTKQVIKDQDLSMIQKLPLNRQILTIIKNQVMIEVIYVQLPI